MRKKSDGFVSQNIQLEGNMRNMHSNSDVKSIKLNNWFKDFVHYTAIKAIKHGNSYETNKLCFTSIKLVM